MSQKLVHEFEILANSLKSGDASNQELSIPALAERIAKTLHVKSDEVAILAVSEKWRHLCFLVPQALRNVGYIPLSSTSALAARTVRDSRPEIDNNFATVRQASVFEGVKDENCNLMRFHMQSFAMRSASAGIESFLVRCISGFEAIGQ